MTDTFHRYELACREGNAFKAIKLAGDEFRYHWVAAKYGIREVIEYLKKRGHYIDWMFLAHIGARWGQKEFVQWIIRKRISSQVWMALNLAAGGGNFYAVRYFIEAFGVEPDEHAVLWASEGGYPEIVKYILNRITKSFDHTRVEHYYKTSSTDQWYRDRAKRDECVQLLREYYEDRIVI